MLDINSLRNAFKKNNTGGASAGQNNYYKFWDMTAGSTATIRFLPDANQDNPFGFLVEKSMHNLKINGEHRTVPCLKMYGEECPICKVSAAYYSKDDKVLGKQYYRKKQHLAQALVVKDPFPKDPETDENSEGKVKLISINYSIFQIIKNAIEQGELDQLPHDYIGGANFIIQKDQNGEYPSYVLSKFSRKSTDLPEALINELKGKLVDLSTLLPKNPGRDKVEAMLEAALSGAPLLESAPAPAAEEEEEEIPKPVVKSAKIAALATAFAADDSDDSDEEVPPVKVKKPEPKVVAKAEVSDDSDDDAEAKAVLEEIRARQRARKAGK